MLEVWPMDAKMHSGGQDRGGYMRIIGREIYHGCIVLFVYLFRGGENVFCSKDVFVALCWCYCYGYIRDRVMDS